MPDRRDPEAVGNFLLELRKGNPDMEFHELADLLREVMIREYEAEPQVNAKKYQMELKKRAADGDPYAISLLAAQDGNL
jgi:hypothetical protein